LDFFELSASTESLLWHGVGGGLNDGFGCLGNALQVVLGYSTSAEDVSVSEVLGCKVADWELRKNDLGARGSDLIELVVDNFPLGIDNLLEVFGVLESDLSRVLLCLVLKFNIKEKNLRVLEALWLLLKSSVRESLSEADSVDEEGVGDRSSCNLLDSDVFLIQVISDGLDGIDDHFSEEILILGNDLRVEGCHSTLFEEITLLCVVFVADLDGNLFDSIEAELEGQTVSLNDVLGVHSFFDVLLGLLEELAGHKDD